MSRTYWRGHTAVETFHRCLRIARSPEARAIRDAVYQLHPPSTLAGEDILLWRHSTDVYKPNYSSSKTLEQIRIHRAKVPWAKLVWFSQGVPRYAFIEWLTFRNRLSTGDRMRVWGGTQSCVLCEERNETRDQLYFACPYSFSVWIESCGSLFGGPATPDWEDMIQLLTARRWDRLDFILICMLLQMTIYLIWRERNGRIHQQKPTPVAGLVRIIDRTMRHRITSLDYRTKPRLQPLLQRWFGSRTVDRLAYS